MFTEDLSAFFSTAEFATAATLNSVAVAGILDAPLALGGDGRRRLLFGLRELCDELVRGLVRLREGVGGLAVA